MTECLQERVRTATELSEAQMLTAQSCLYRAVLANPRSTVPWCFVQFLASSVRGFCSEVRGNAHVGCWLAGEEQSMGRASRVAGFVPREAAIAGIAYNLNFDLHF